VFKRIHSSCFDARPVIDAARVLDVLANAGEAQRTDHLRAPLMPAPAKSSESCGDLRSCCNHRFSCDVRVLRRYASLQGGSSLISPENGH
jgi:hypothetical protein